MLDEDAFVTQAMALVNDPALARALGAAARRTALELDWDCIVDQIEHVFLCAALRTGLASTVATPGALAAAGRSPHTVVPND
jgi:hypothetical protein